MRIKVHYNVKTCCLLRKLFTKLTYTIKMVPAVCTGWLFSSFCCDNRGMSEFKSQSQSYSCNAVFAGKDVYFGSEAYCKVSCYAQS